MRVSNLSRQLARLAMVAFGLTTVACMLQANAFAVKCNSGKVNKSCTLHIASNMTISPTLPHDSVFLYENEELTWESDPTHPFHLHFDDHCFNAQDYDSVVNSEKNNEVRITPVDTFIHCGYTISVKGVTNPDVSIDPHVIIIGQPPRHFDKLWFVPFKLLFWLVSAAWAATFAFGKLRSRSAS